MCSVIRNHAVACATEEELDYSEISVFAPHNLAAKADLWREEAQLQPDRAEAMEYWASRFSRMAGLMQEESANDRAPAVAAPIRPARPEMPRRNPERFDAPDWMQKVMV